MNLPHTVYDGNGITKQFDIPFPYLRKSHIKVKVGGQLASFTFINDSRIEIDPAPQAGEPVTIRRQTPSIPLHIIQDGQPIPAKKHNEMLLQCMYRSEEKEVDAIVQEIQGLVSQVETFTETALEAKEQAQAANAQAQAAAATATQIANFDPTLKLDKAGGTISGNLTVDGEMHASNIYTKMQADDKFLTQSNAQFLPLEGGTVTGDIIREGTQLGFYKLFVPDGTQDGGGVAFIPQAGGKSTEFSYLAGGGLRIYIEDTGNSLQLDVQGNLILKGKIYYGSMDKTIAASLNSDGNIHGTIWQPWGHIGAKQAIDARIEQRSILIANDRKAWCVTDTRVAGYVEVTNGHLPSGYFGTALLKQYSGGGGDNGGTTEKLGGRQFQVFVQNGGGWRQAAHW